MIKSVHSLSISGSYLLDLVDYSDNRGKYIEDWNEKEYQKFLPEGIKFVQSDYSRSTKNVLRGLHHDGITWKLIQCIYGTINFVMFDVNTHKAFETILSDQEPQQVLVPPQCANGHYVMSDEAIFYYKQSTVYPTKQDTVKWDDPAAEVRWMGLERNQIPILSPRDSEGPFRKL